MPLAFSSMDVGFFPLIGTVKIGGFAGFWAEHLPVGRNSQIWLAGLGLMVVGGFFRQGQGRLKNAPPPFFDLET